MKHTFTIIVLTILFNANAQYNSELMRSTTGVAGTTSTLNQGSNTLVIQQSIGQGSGIGTFTSGHEKNSIFFR